MAMTMPDLNLLGLMPCPLKVPLEQQISEKIQDLTACGCDSVISYQIVSNAVKQEHVFLNVAQAKTLDDLPDIMIAPGISRFFYPDFVETFRNSGCFQSACPHPPAELYKDLNLVDPDGYYDVIAFNPLVFLIDKTRHPDLPEPRRWADLLNPCYEGLVAYRGHKDTTFCESVLLTIYQEFGYEGIIALAKTVKSKLHPAEMAKFAGSGSPDAPAVSVIPVFFANTVRPSPAVSVVWPEDGAAVNPLVMLVKKEAPEALRELGSYMAGEEIGRIMHSAGYYSVHPNLETPDFMSGAYKWVGWDFVFGNDISKLLKELNELMHEHLYQGVAV
jgi:ABC-type Fe3+ transport system substrate-binding protein